MSQQYITEELNQLQKEISSKNPKDVLQFCFNYFNAKLQAQRSQLFSQKDKAQQYNLDLFPTVDSIQPSFKSPFGVNDPHSNSPPPKGTDQDPLKKKIPNAFNANRRTSVSAEALNPAKLSNWKPPTNNLSTTEEETLANNLKDNFLFKQLDINSKKTVITALQQKNFKKDTVIIKQGDEGDYFYIIEDGTVDFYVNDAKVSSSSEGGSFGELALMYNSPRAATAIAATDVTCWALDRLTFRRILLEGTFNKRLMYENFLKDVTILKGLNDQERAKLADALTSELYKSGTKIIEQGDFGDQFFLIEKGTCDIVKDGETIKSITKGDYFGELALLKDVPRQATVVAKDDVIVATLNKAGFERLLGSVVDLLRQQDPTI